MTTTNTPRCAICGSTRRKLEEHHPTGRDADGNYFDPEWTITLCVRCHGRCHLGWSFAGLDSIPAGMSRCGDLIRDHRGMDWAVGLLRFGEPSPSTLVLAALVVILGLRVSPWKQGPTSPTTPEVPDAA